MGGVNAKSRSLALNHHARTGLIWLVVPTRGIASKLPSTGLSKRMQLDRRGGLFEVA